MRSISEKLTDKVHLSTSEMKIFVLFQGKVISFQLKFCFNKPSVSASSFRVFLWWQEEGSYSWFWDLFQFRDCLEDMSANLFYAASMTIFGIIPARIICSSRVLANKLLHNNYNLRKLDTEGVPKLKPILLTKKIVWNKCTNLHACSAQKVNRTHWLQTYIHKSLLNNAGYREWPKSWCGPALL